MSLNPHSRLNRAFDDARFGSLRTLDLRTSMPTGEDAVRRADAWLRERQVSIGGEVLLVTGRGLGSHGGVAVVKEAVRKRLTLLKRKGVVAAVAEHTPGSYVVTLAPVRSLFEAGARSRTGEQPAQPRDAAELLGLSADTRAALRKLAVRALESLGAPANDQYVRDEMLRQFSVMAGVALTGERQDEQRLREIVDAALDAYDDE